MSNNSIPQAKLTIEVLVTFHNIETASEFQTVLNELTKHGEGALRVGLEKTMNEEAKGVHFSVPVLNVEAVCE